MSDPEKRVPGEDEAMRIMERIGTDFALRAALSTTLVIAEFRRRAPSATHTDDEILDLLVEMARVHHRAIRFDRP